MRAKGSIFKSIDDYVKTNHSPKYNQWKDMLPSASKNLVETVKNADWYPIKTAFLDPMKVTCEALKIDEKTCAWATGRFSANQSLNGIYKVFIMVSTPTFILKRAPRIMTTFYDPSNLKIINSKENSVFISCDKLPTNSILLEYRIAGWIERAGEICGCKNMKVEITKSLAMGNQTFDISASWD